MNNLAIIPARSGSKGLRNKNIKELCGKPLLAYTIEAAKNSNQFVEIIVSTDSSEYADIARKYGAKVPFLRSKETSNDNSSTWDAVDEVLDNYRKNGRKFDTFAILQPTSPLRNSTHVSEAYNLYKKKGAKAIISVCENEHSPVFSNCLYENNEMINFVDRSNMLRRQEIAKYYRLNGAIYISNIDFYLQDHYLYREGSFAYIMSQKDSIDIDTIYDFKMAELIISER